MLRFTTRARRKSRIVISTVKKREREIKGLKRRMTVVDPNTALPQPRT